MHTMTESKRAIFETNQRKGGLYKINPMQTAGATIATIGSPTKSIAQGGKNVSFKAVVDDLENEINQLYQDFSYCKKEV